jgi:hypothetical protein
MASVNKNFVVKHGLEVNSDLILADANRSKVGIGTSYANYDLEVYGDIGAKDLSITGVATITNLKINGGYIEADNSVGGPGQYLRSTGSGIEWASFPTFRTSGKFTAGIGQTRFDYAYYPGFIDLYLNGIKLVESEYEAADGVKIFLNNPCFGGEQFEIIGYNPASVSAGSTGILGISILEEGTVVGNDNGVTSINFIGAALTAVGTGAGVTVYFEAPIGWAQNGSTVYATHNIGIGTTVSRYPLEIGSTVGTSGTSLWVNGDARVTGILTIGSSSVTINGYDDIISVGTGITMFGNTGIISARDLYINGIGVTNLVAGASVSISDVPPSSPDPGNLWYSNVLGRGFIYYNDGDTQQWVDFSPAAASIGEKGIDVLWKTNPLGIHTLTNVGIGTSVLSSSLLTVAGDITANTFIGTATTATYLSDASNIITGIVSTSRLVGSYDIDISGKANSAEYAIIAGLATDATNAVTATNVVGGIASVTDLDVSTSAKILDLSFPAGTGLNGQALITDGSGNLGFATVSRLSDNRIYVSSTNGDDANDGKYSAVKTIKKAAQLASIQGGPVSIYVETGEYVEDNPIILYEDISIIGDNLRNTVIRPLNAGKDMFRVRNGSYITNVTLKDNLTNNVPQYTFNYGVAFDDPNDTTTSRVGYASTTERTLITRSPYIQNCSIISFLGANGVLVDGSKVKEPNIPAILEELEKPVDAPYPSQGRSMIANAFTMISFGGTGWRCINDGYAQIVSCFQIFCLNGSYCQSGGYLSITNSATNFGLYALRSSGFSKNSFIFDRGLVASNGTFEGRQTLKIIGAGRSDQNLYVTKFYNKNLEDKTTQFKPTGISTITFDGVSGINTISNEITTLVTHGLVNGDSLVYTQSSNGPVGSLIDQSQYFVEVVGINTIRLYEDEPRTQVVNLYPTSAGIHTLSDGVGEFFISQFTSTSNSYQELTLDSSSYNFIPGRLVTQSSTSASGYALTYYSDKLIVAKESVVDFNVGTINDHSFVPSSATINSIAGIASYHTLNAVIDSTVSGQQIQNISNLNEEYYVHLHRPSTVNSSSHTWEYAGSGLDYNALPENGGKPNPYYEQVSERGGRVYTSGTNELGDFKVGDAIVAFNRTGDIIFNNTVTIGELTSLKFSFSNGPEITEISTDIDLGDNEPGGATDSRITTQKAQRSFLNNRLGSFVDKSTSTSSVPNAIVVLNSSGQLNQELIPISGQASYYNVNVSGARTSLVDDIPANNILAGDYVVEDTGISTVTYQLVNDRFSQYLVLSEPNRDYNFTNGQLITSVNNNAIGFATAPTSVGYGTTANVKGVIKTVQLIHNGSGYTPGIYTNVSIASSTGIGNSARADVTVSAGGQVIDVDFKYGGKYYTSGDILTITSIPISGSNYAALNILNTENRLYLKLADGIKFTATATSPDFIQDNDAVGLQTALSTTYTLPFDALNNVETGLNRIIIGINTYADGDPVVYNNGGNTSIGGLTHNETYYVKKVGITSVELYTNYGLTNILSLVSSGTGIQELDRVGVNTSSNFIVLENHGYSTGDAIKVSGSSLPAGISTDNYYFVGSVVQNAFTLHNFRSDAFASVNGLSVNAIGITSSGIGTASFTKQNVQYNQVVNTSSAYESNYSILSAANIDASNIISGTISPSRLGTGSATEDTFLAGNSEYKKVVQGVGIGSTEPITASSSAGLDNSNPGVTTYFGNVNLSLNRVSGSSGDPNYTNIGVSRFKKSTFDVDNDGTVGLKYGAASDIDADKLDGQQGSFYLDPSNLTSAVPVNKGGTNLTSIPTSGTILVGNGVGYNLTENPIIGGSLSAVSIGVTHLDVTGIGTITTLNNTNANISNLSGTIGTITTFNSTNGTITTLNNTYFSGNNANLSGVCTAVDFNATSDIRLKENINTYENALETIDKIRGVKFTWKENQKNSIGVIAQEIEEVIPELVINGCEVKTVNYNGIIGVLIEAIKELKNENKVLSEKINKLNDNFNNK